MNRIDSIRSKKCAEIKERFSTPKKFLKGRERLSLLKEGKVKLRDDIVTINNYTDVTDAFDFSPFESEGGLTEVGQRLIDMEVERACRLKDKLQLGDAAQALEAIRDYETFDAMQALDAANNRD